MNIGNVHLQADNIKKAITFFENALFLAQEIDYLQGLSNSFEKLYNAYEMLNMHDEALLYHKLFIDMRDSLMRKENIEAVIKNNLEYAFQKERELSNLEQQKIDIVTKENEKRKNLIIIIILISFCILIIIFLMVYRSYKEKQRSNFILEDKNTLIN